MEDFQHDGFFATLMRDAMDNLNYWNAKKDVDDLLSCGMEFKDRQFISSITMTAMYALLHLIKHRIQNADEFNDELRDIQPLSAAIVAYLHACDT